MITSFSADGGVFAVKANGVLTTADVRVLRKNRTLAQVQALVDAMCAQFAGPGYVVACRVKALNPPDILVKTWFNLTEPPKDWWLDA